MRADLQGAIILAAGAKIKPIDLLDIIRKLLYALNRFLLARAAIRLVVRAPFSA